MAVGVSVAVSVGVAVDVGVAVGVTVTVGVAVTDGVRVTVGVLAATIFVIVVDPTMPCCGTRLTFIVVGLEDTGGLLAIASYVTPI